MGKFAEKLVREMRKDKRVFKKQRSLSQRGIPLETLRKLTPKQIKKLQQQI